MIRVKDRKLFSIRSIRLFVGLVHSLSKCEIHTHVFIRDFTPSLRENSFVYQTFFDCRFAARQFTVRLGDIDLSTDREPSAPVTFKVSEVRAHPRFSRVGFYNDIAVLVLEGAVRKSKYVIPVCMPQTGLIPHKERLPGEYSE